MPDSTISPGRPLLRDTSRRTNEQGAGAPRRTSPGTAAAAGAARPHGGGQGSIARAERVELRWRDIQWVDFTSEPDSGMEPAAERRPAPEPMPAPTRAQPADAPRDPPTLDTLMRRLAETAPAIPTAPKAEAIPGLAPRFTRLPVPRLAPAQAQSPARRATLIEPEPTARTAPAAKPVSVVVHPRTPSTISTPPIAAGPPPGPPALPAAAETEEHAQIEHEPPFPASISTPVSVGAETDASEPIGGWRLAVAAGAIVAGDAVRRVSVVAGSGVARARAAVPRRQRGEAAPGAKSATGTRLSDAAGQISRYVAARENRLRVSGMAALGVVLVALVAYAGGAVIARVAEPNIASAPVPPAAPAEPPATDAVGKQLTMADKALHPAPATTPAAPAVEPPTDPAARAAFYIARARTGDAAAQYDVGVLYAQGQGLVQDYASAATWFRAAAAQGNIAAEYNLGVLYAQGLGVTANATEAINWYRSAADQNHPGAQFNLGLAYATGSGAKQDFAAAARWYQRAAAQGLAPAMVNLAILYEAGSGVERSPVDAYAWYSAAGERGDAAAKARAAELFQQFTDKDKARAEGLAATIGAALDSFSGAAPPA